MGYHLGVIGWQGLIEPQILQVIANAIAYPLELGVKTLLLKASQNSQNMDKLSKYSLPSFISLS